jgi:hypothetical protein
VNGRSGGGVRKKELTQITQMVLGCDPRLMIGVKAVLAVAAAPNIRIQIPICLKYLLACAMWRRLSA